MQLSSNFERLKEEYYILTEEIERSTYIKEAEDIMDHWEEVLPEIEFNIMKIHAKTKSHFASSFMIKNKVSRYRYNYIYLHIYVATYVCTTQRLFEGCKFHK